jgi:hypothetical protein
MGGGAELGREDAAANLVEAVTTCLGEELQSEAVFVRLPTGRAADGEARIAEDATVRSSTSARLSKPMPQPVARRYVVPAPTMGTDQSL